VTISTRRLLVGNNTQGIIDGSALINPGAYCHQLEASGCLLSPTVVGHRRGRTESRAYQQRACDGKGASGRPSTRKGRVESVYQRRACDGKAAKGAVYSW
jgi:hypothetical protein